MDQSLSLLKQTDCTHFFYAPEMKPKAVELRKQMTNLAVEPLAPFDDWLARYTQPYLYDKGFEDSKWDPIVVLHSSGSTGKDALLTPHPISSITDSLHP